MSAYDYLVSTDGVIGCDELPCVDVGVGIYHHPYCGMNRDEAEYAGPPTPEEEETWPVDPGRVL